MQLTLAGGVIAAFAHGPLALALCAAAFGVISLQPPDFSLAVFGYCVAAFAALTACALTRNLAHARAALTMPFYWPLATLAALSALFDLVVRPHHWAKTTHGVAQRRAPILMGAALARVRTANAPAETQRAFG